MPLYDSPPHSCDVYTSSHAADSAGGSAATYTLSASGVACSINLASAGEQERFAQQGIVVTHRVAFLGSAVTLTRGGKLVSGTRSFHIKGIEVGEAYGNVPALTYANVESQL